MVRVVDGDTIDLRLDLGWHISYSAKVRISHINAPELNTAAGQAAREYARTILPVGTKVYFSSYRLDKYGRPLGSILLPNDETFASKMLLAGHAEPVT